MGNSKIITGSHDTDDIIIIMRLIRSTNLHWSAIYVK